MAHGIILKDESTGLVNSLLRNNASSQRIYTLQDRSGTLADTSDVYNLSTVSITGATTLTSTAYGKLHLCSGTAANYTVDLPTAASHAGESIAFKGLFGLTRIVTIDPDGSEFIDGAGRSTVRLLSEDIMVLMSDGTNWITTHRSPQNKIIGQSIPATTVTGTTSETLIDSVFIPANTIKAGDFIDLTDYWTKVGTGNSWVLRYKHHTLNQISGATNIMAPNPSSTVLWAKTFRRIICVSQTSQRVMNTALNILTEDNTPTSGSAISTLSIDFTLDQYLIRSITLNNAADTGAIASSLTEIKRG